MRFQQQLALFATWLCLTPQIPAQETIAAERPTGIVLTRPYRGTTVAPVRRTNTDRLHSLIRAGKLYLTAQDVVALAIENNIDLEVDRYGLPEAEWNVERAEAGGPLRGINGGNSVLNQVTGGQGVAGSLLSAGFSSGGGGGGSGGNATVTQIGPVTANLDAVLQSTLLWSHQSSLEPNTTVSQTPNLVQNKRTYANVLQQGLLSGGYVQVTANESYLNENAPSDNLNPSVAPVVQIYLRHNLLQSFGTEVNSRFIRVARKNRGLASETFRSQLLNQIVAVLNLYWDLVSDNEDLKTKRQTLEVAQKFYEDTTKQIGLGVVARAEIFRAEAELNTRRRDVSLAEATMHQQENSLKNVISINGLADPLLDAAEIVPLDALEIPPTDEELPSLRDLVARALAKRPDVAIDKINEETQKISAVGTKSGLLPSLQGFASVTENGLAGTATPQDPKNEADPAVRGGLGTALGQIFANHFPSRRAGLSFIGSINNHMAQGDYGIEQLQLRQNEMIRRRTGNQLVVDISNNLVALRQARARYNAAVDGRRLQEELLEKEQQRFSLGGSTINDLITVQRSLADARVTEIAAKSTYSHARISLDQVLGETLEKNHISLDEGLSGHSKYESHLPAEN